MFSIDKSKLINNYNELWDYYRLDDNFPLVAAIKRRSDYGKKFIT